jgi:hypothetical protein
MTPTLNGHPILSGTITEQSSGVWHAEAALDAETPPSGSVTIEVEGVRWVGTVLRAREEHGQVRVKAVGGAGGLSTELPALNYVNTTAATVLADMFRAAGETLSGTSATGLDSFQLANWHRERSPASIALTALTTELGYRWRVLRDGTVWIGQQDWPETTASVTELDSDWAAGTFELVDALGLEPGSTYQGHQIHQVTHFIGPSGIRTEARITSSSGVLERILTKVQRQLDRAKIWPGTVARQSSEDGYPIDVLPDGKDTRVRAQGLGRVQQLVGLPGFRVRVPEGTRGAWTMLGGDPSRPRWMGWEQGGAAEVTELCFAGGTQAVARVNDSADCGELYAVITAPYGVMTLHYKAPGSSTWIPVASGPIPPTTESGTPVAALITSGNTKFLA